MLHVNESCRMPYFRMRHDYMVVAAARAAAESWKVLQCVAVCCSVSQCAAVYCSVLQRVVVFWHVLQRQRRELQPSCENPFMCDMAHPYVTRNTLLWDDMHSCHEWPIHMWHDYTAAVATSLETLVICDMPHPYVTWTTHSYVTWLKYVTRRTHSYRTWLYSSGSGGVRKKIQKWHDSSVTWKSHSMWHDSSVTMWHDSSVKWKTHSMTWLSYVTRTTCVYVT